MRSREEMFPGTDKVELFLSDLAVNGHMAASTQNQAFKERGGGECRTPNIEPRTGRSMAGWKANDPEAAHE